MASLLRDERIVDFDVIALQEPWRNNYINTTHYPGGQHFQLVYLDHPETRTCFLINKRIPRARWTATLHSPDLCTLAVENGCRKGTQTTHIHNVYNPIIDTGQSTTPLLREILMQPTEGNRIVLGDFNLHTPTGEAKPAQDTTIKQTNSYFSWMSTS